MMRSSERGSAEKEEEEEDTPEYSTKTSLRDLYLVLGNDNRYFLLCVALNSLVFAVFHNYNRKNQVLLYEEGDYRYVDEQGRIQEPEHPRTLNENGDVITPNGAVPVGTLTLLYNFSSILGSYFAFKCARIPIRPAVTVLSVFLVSIFLLAQAFRFSFFDRIAFLLFSALSKSVSILTIQGAYESGPDQYRVFAVGLAYYLECIFVFFTMILFKNETANDAETLYMFLITGVAGFYALICPNHLLRSLIRRDPVKLQEIFDKFSYKARSKILNFPVVLDDILYRDYIPNNVSDIYFHLVQIPPFKKKFIVLMVLFAFQSRLSVGEPDLVKTMVPMGPMESVVFSRFASAIGCLFLVFCVAKIGRRMFLVLNLSVNLLTSLYISLIPIDTVSRCSENDMVNGQHFAPLIFAYLLVVTTRMTTHIMVVLLLLEHIPTLYRAHLFPLALASEAVFALLCDVAPRAENNLFDTPFFIRPMIRFSLLSLLTAVFFVDDTDVSVFSSVDMPCYNMIRKKKAIGHRRQETKTDFEEKFRLLCEVRANEVAMFKSQKEKDKKEEIRVISDYLLKKQRINKEQWRAEHDENGNLKSKRELKRMETEKYEEEKGRIEKDLAEYEPKIVRFDEHTKGLLRRIRRNRMVNWLNKYEPVPKAQVQFSIE